MLFPCARTDVPPSNGVTFRQALNPLDCKASNKLTAGNRLYAGEAICFSEEGGTGALEFGLDNDGHPIFYDHLNVDPEVIIWTDQSVTGEYLTVLGDTLLLYDKEFGKVNWGVGDCGGMCGFDSYDLTVLQDGTVSFASVGGEETLWTIQKTGRANHSCPSLPIEASKDSFGGGAMAGAVVGSIVGTALVIGFLMFVKGINRNNASSTQSIPKDDSGTQDQEGSV